MCILQGAGRAGEGRVKINEGVWLEAMKEEKGGQGHLIWS